MVGSLLSGRAGQRDEEIFLRTGLLRAQFDPAGDLLRIADRRQDAHDGSGRHILPTSLFDAGRGEFDRPFAGETYPVAEPFAGGGFLPAVFECVAAPAPRQGAFDDLDPRVERRGRYRVERNGALVVEIVLLPRADAAAERVHLHIKNGVGGLRRRAVYRE